MVYVAEKSFSSILWVATTICIDNGKLLGVTILSKSCKGYTSMRKFPLLIPIVTRHGSYLIIVVLIIPILPLEWKQEVLLGSLRGAFITLLPLKCNLLNL